MHCDPIEKSGNSDNRLFSFVHVIFLNKARISFTSCEINLLMAKQSLKPPVKGIKDKVINR